MFDFSGDYSIVFKMTRFRLLKEKKYIYVICETRKSIIHTYLFERKMVNIKGVVMIEGLKWKHMVCEYNLTSKIKLVESPRLLYKYANPENYFHLFKLEKI